MTGRRVRIQAVVLAVILVVSIVATGAAFAGTTLAQSNGNDNTGSGSDIGGGSNTGSGSATGGSNTGSGSATGGSNTGSGSATGSGSNTGDSNTGGGSDAGSGASDATGSGNAGSGTDAPQNTTPTATGTPTGSAAANAGATATEPAANGAGPNITEVVQQVSQTAPDAAAEVDIEDTKPETPGTTVTPGNRTDSVSSVTLADEALGGTVDIKEYRNPPTAVTESITNTVAQNVASDPAADDVGNNSDRNETATTEQATTNNVSVITVANISVFDEDGEKASDAAATISMEIDSDEVDDPQNATVVHETDDGWEELDTSVVNTTTETVTLAAETGGFSIFAVAEVEPDDEESATDSVSDATDDSTPGFGVWVALVAIAGVALLSWRRSAV